jgi:hypothetical protein
MSAKTYLVVSACLGAAIAASGCRARAAATVRTGPPPPRHVHRPAPPPSFDPAGWELIGETWVDGKSDADRIPVGAKEGRFSKLMLVVEQSDLEMLDMEITFGNGEKASPAVRQFFRENTRTRPIDLPGAARAIKNITFHYGNLPGGGRARVAVYGKPGEGPPPGPILKATFDTAGWVLIGERVVEGKGDFDQIKVGKAEGKFQELMVVVEDSDLEMHDMEITFGNGKKQKPAVKHFFREADRTRAIDLKGNTRVIKNLKFWYSNLPGGGKARVAVYGR